MKCLGKSKQVTKTTPSSSLIVSNMVVELERTQILANKYKQITKIAKRCHDDTCWINDGASMYCFPPRNCIGTRAPGTAGSNESCAIVSTAHPIRPTREFSSFFGNKSWHGWLVASSNRPLKDPLETQKRLSFPDSPRD